MKLNDLYTLKEDNEQNTILSEAVWWFTRWVSGSMRDPDWEEGWIEHVKDITTAFLILSRYGAAKSAKGQILWRYLGLSEREAKRISREKTLYPRENKIGFYGHFQSFTTKRDIAVEFADDIGSSREPISSIIISAKPPNQKVMVSMRDMLNSKLIHRGELADWHHQDEVIVLVDEPLKLKSVEIL